MSTTLGPADEAGSVRGPPPPPVTTAVPPTSSAGDAGPSSPLKPFELYSTPEIGPSATTVLLEEDADALDVTSYTG